MYLNTKISNMLNPMQKEGVHGRLLAITTIVIEKANRSRLATFSILRLGALQMFRFFLLPVNLKLQKVVQVSKLAGLQRILFDQTVQGFWRGLISS
jgi:hypothetical protein